MSKLYVAYGSNLNLEQMKFRCPTARLIATGTIDDYELQFKGMPNCAFATIASKEGAKVPVALWEIMPRDELVLDRYEGCPRSYFKTEINVNINDNEVPAMVYVMNLKQDFGIPSDQYYDTVAKGYMDCGFDVDVLNSAVDESAERYYKRHPVALEDEDLSFDDDYSFDDEDEDEDEAFGGMEL